MSAEAVGWVWRFSPMEKSGLLVHLALADVTNDLHGNRLWCSTDTLTQKTRLSRRAVVTALDRLVAEGLLEEDVRPGKTTLYRFLFPDLPVQLLHPPVQEVHDTRAESAPELNRTQPDNSSSYAENAQCGAWTDVEDAKSWTVAPCVLEPRHGGPHQAARKLKLAGVRESA
jgi:hypothetical protein